MTDLKIPLIEKPAGVFVTGSDTEIGKTFVACAIVRSLKMKYPRVGVYKPVASGVTDVKACDAYRLWEAADLTEIALERICPQSFTAPVAPMIAAAEQHKKIDIEAITLGFDFWLKNVPFTVVEGAGGFLSPITEHLNNADLAKSFQLPVIAVVPNRLGCVNQAMLVLEVARARNIQTLAIVLNQIHNDPTDQSIESNLGMLRQAMDNNGFTEIPIHHFGYLQSHLIL